MNLKSLIGEGKTFNGCPKKVPIKSNPDKATPCNLIDNITDYMNSFKKGSSQIRKVFTNASPTESKIDLAKFQEKIHSLNGSINQIKNCLKTCNLNSLEMIT